MIIQVGKGNSYTQVFDPTAKTITLSGLSNVDLTTNSVVSVYNTTRGSAFPAASSVTISSVNGLNVHTLTFSSVPAASASTDDLVLQLNIPDAIAMNDTLQVGATANKNSLALAPLARTATTTGADLKNLSYRGCHVIIDVTAGATGVDTITPKIQGKDAVSGKYYDLLVGTAISAVGTTVLKIYPALTAAANVASNDMLPVDFRVVVSHATAASVTYSVAVNLVK